MFRAPSPLSSQLSERLSGVEAGIVRGLGSENRRFLGRADEAWVETVDGQRLLDFTSQYGVMVLGYRLSAESHDLKGIPHSMTGITPTESYVDLLEELQRVLGRWDKTKVALTVTGSEAVEVAIKAAVLHTGRSGVITFANSFHGQSLGVLPYIGQVDLVRPLAAIAEANTVTLPYPAADGSAELDREVLDSVRRLLTDATPTGFGTVLIEPMQNLAGYRPVSAGFLAGVERECREAGAVLVADEIFTGFARCGEWLLVDRLNVRPHLVCVGKGMTGGWPLAACIGDANVLDVPPADTGLPLHGSTFMGHPMATSAALDVVREIEHRELLDKARSIETVVRGALSEFVVPFQLEVRGFGAAMAIDFAPGRSAEVAVSLAGEVSNRLASVGVLTITNGFPQPTTLPICPPVTIGNDDLDLGLSRIKSMIEEVLSVSDGGGS